MFSQRKRLTRTKSLDLTENTEEPIEFEEEQEINEAMAILKELNECKDTKQKETAIIGYTKIELIKQELFNDLFWDVEELIQKRKKPKARADMLFK